MATKSNKRKAIITNWDTGMSTSKRATTLEELNSGFSLIRNFDIYADPKVIKPVPEFTSWATPAEESLEFKGLGSSTDTFFATGKMRSNWFATGWQYRVHITQSAGATPYSLYNLANMPASFWGNIQTGGQDIRITTSNGYTYVPSAIISIDTNIQTGWLMFPAGTDFYIYYGNPDAVSVSAGIYTQIDSNAAYPYGYWYNFINSVYPQNARFDIPANFDNNDQITYPSTTIPGFITRGISTGTYRGGVSDPNYPSNSNLTVSYLVYFKNAVPANVNLIEDDQGAFVLGLTGGRPFLRFDTTTDPSSTITATTLLTGNTLYRIVATFDRNNFARLYINGVLEASDTTTNNSLDNSGATLTWTLNSNTNMDIISYVSTVYSTIQITNEWTMINTNSAFWTTSAEQSDPGPTYLTVGETLYKKDLNDTAWTPVIYSIPIQDPTYLPVVSPIFATFSTGIINFFGIDTVDGNFIRLNQANRNYITPARFGADTFYFTSGINEQIPTVDEGLDSKFYVSNLNTGIVSVSGSTITNNVFLAYPAIQSVQSFNGYITVGGYRNNTNKSWVQFWNRSSTLATESIDFGQGQLRVLGNVKGNLFAVINNYIDDSDKALISPSMDVRLYQGGNTVKTTHRISLPRTMDDYYTNSWEQPVSQLKGLTKNAVIFYAKIPDDLDGTYLEGLWAVGVNEVSGKLALCLLHDTSAQGNVFNMSSLANQIVIFTGSTKVWHLNPTPTYTNTARVETKIFNDGNSERSKQIIGCEVMHEPLVTGQSIKIYKKTQDDMYWVHVATNTTVGSTSKEYNLNQDTRKSIGNFKEIQWAIESTGGDAGLVQFAFTYEILEDNV